MYDSSFILLPVIFLLGKADKSKFMFGSEIEALSRESLSRCTINACKRFFSSDFETVTVSMPLEQVAQNLKSSVLVSHLMLPALEEENRWTILIKNLKLPDHNIRKHAPKSESYIVQIRKEGELMENVKRLRRFLSWNPHAKFLIMSPTVFLDPHGVAVEAIQALWKYNVINAVILLANRENTTKYDVYSWQPYSKYSCANNFSTTHSIDSCYFGMTERNVSWFDEKISRKVYNCSVKVNYMKWPPFVNDVDSKSAVSRKSPGIEINLLNTIAQKLNVHLVYNRTAYTTWGNIFHNGTATGDLKHLLTNEIDIVAGGYGSTHPRTLYFDCSRAYMQEPLVWCVPFELMPRGLKNMITLLSLDTWICLLLMYFLVTILIWYISYGSTNESKTYKSFINCLYNNFTIFFGYSIKVLPRTSWVRYFLVMFMIFSLILNSAYTSYFTSIVSAPSYVQKYKNMGDIYKYNLKTYFLPNSILFFQNYKGEKEIHEVPVSLILERWRNCTDIPACLKKTAKKRNSAFCVSRIHQQYLANNNKKVRKKMSLIHCFKESVVSMQVNFIMRKGFPLFKIFDDVLKRIISSGFIVKWKNDNLKGEIKDQPVMGSNYDDSRIKLVNLTQLFRVIFVGQLISLLVFIGEHVLYRITVAKNRDC